MTAVETHTRQRATATDPAVAGGVDALGIPDGVAAEDANGSWFGALIELGKPRLSAMALFAVLAGAFFAATPDVPSLGLLLPLGFGALLVAMAGHALNMVLERDIDARMGRTVARPLPSGRLRTGHGIAFGAATAALGLGVLAVSVPPIATALCAAILVGYVAIYTPLKRVSTLNTLVGAVPGALPPVVGYAAVAGALDLRAAVLFGMLFFWQIPHFLAISWRYRDDYRRGGLRMLAVDDPDGRGLGRQMVVYCAALVAVSTLPWSFGMAGGLYLVAAACLGVLFLVPCAFAALLRTPAAMRQAFVVSIVYLPLLLAALVLDARPVGAAF